MKSKDKTAFLVILILVSMAVSPAIALGEGNRNLLLIGVMAMSPVIILYYGRFDRINGWLALFMASIILFPLVGHPESMRWSTVLYSVMFCLTFMAYSELLKHSYFTPINYQKLLKYLIYAYAITLIIQQFCVLTGLPVFNLSNHNPIEPWKLNSLAAEPSHSARIVALLMYCYITITELIQKRKYNFKIQIKKDKWVWLAFVWTMVTMGSGTAFLFIGIVLLKFMRFRNLVPTFIIGGTILFLVENLEVSAYERTYETVLATLTLDENTIIKTDHSAAIRIVPLIVLAKMVDITTWDGWFGHGVDYVGSFLGDYIPGLPEGVSGGGFFALWMEYGFISFTLFFIFSLSSSYRKGDYISILFWFMLVFLYGINSQIVWLCIVLLFTNRHFLKMTTSKYILQNVDT
jgi:hypothetical protein